VTLPQSLIRFIANTLLLQGCFGNKKTVLEIWTSASSRSLPQIALISICQSRSPLRAGLAKHTPQFCAQG
jgi:hypothetical protein